MESSSIHNGMDLNDSNLKVTAAVHTKTLEQVYYTMQLHL
jgi:hypothetical protein